MAIVQEVYKLQREVYVNGVRRACLGVNSVNGFKAGGIATASVEVAADEGLVYAKDIVTVRMSKDNGARFDQIFHGEIDGDSIKLWPKTVSFAASGILARAQARIGAPPRLGEVVPVDEDGNEIPYIKWPKDDADTTDYTDGMIVTEVLALYGITNVAIHDTGEIIASQTVGTLALSRSDSGLALIQQIDTDFFCRTFDGPDGVVRRLPVDGIPAATTFTFLEGRDLLDAQRQRSSREIINRVTCEGVQNDAFTPKSSLDADAPRSPTTGQPLVPTPPGYNAEERKSRVLRTEAQCAAYCGKRLGASNRVREDATWQLPKGNGLLRGGQSLNITSPTLQYANTVFFVEEVRHRSTQEAWLTDIATIGAYAADGLSANQRPLAIFTYAILLEYVGGVATYVITADGGGSYDPDGMILVPATPADPDMGIPGAPEQTLTGIALYQWSSTLGAPTLFDGGQRAMWTYSAGDPSGQTITLTVYDQFGAAGSTTATIDTDAVPPLLRDLWAALATQLDYTSDGEQTWKTFAVAAVGCCKQAADSYQLAWTAGGALYKCTIAGLVAALLAPTNITAAYVRWKYPESTVKGDRAWAGGSDGKIWQSTDFGATWANLSTIPGGLTVRAIQESPFAENDLFVLAGNKEFHSFDGVTWAETYAHPNAALAARDFAAGFERGYTVYGGAAATVPEVSRVHERADRTQGDWSKLNPPGIDYPADPTSVTIGVYTPEIFAVGDDKDGVHRAWSADASAPFTFARKVYNAALGKANQVIRDGQFDRVVYGAAPLGLFKTTSGFEVDCLTIRALVAPLVGKAIGYGTLRPRFVAGNLTISAGIGQLGTGDPYASAIVAQLANGKWTKLSDHPDRTTGDAWRPILRVGLNTYITYVAKRGRSFAAVSPSAWRSTDNCKTWTSMGLDSVRRILRAKDGTLYALCGELFLYRSTTGGATWSLVSTLPTSMFNLAIAGTTPNVLAGKMENGLLYSRDFGATWSPLAGDPSSGHGDYWPDRFDTYIHATPDGTAALWMSTWDANHGGTVPRRAALGQASAGQAAPPYAFNAEGVNVGQTMYHLADSGGARVSEDQGLTWADYFRDQANQMPGGNGGGARALIFGPGGEVYIATFDGRPGGGASNQTIVMLPAGADPAGRWTNVSDTMAADLGANYLPWLLGLAI